MDDRLALPLLRMTPCSLVLLGVRAAEQRVGQFGQGGRRGGHLDAQAWPGAPRAPPLPPASQAGRRAEGGEAPEAQGPAGSGRGRGRSGRRTQGKRRLRQLSNRAMRQSRTALMNAVLSLTDPVVWPVVISASMHDQRVLQDPEAGPADQAERADAEGAAQAAVRHTPGGLCEPQHVGKLMASCGRVDALQQGSCSQAGEGQAEVLGQHHQQQEQVRVGRRLGLRGRRHRLLICRLYVIQ